MVSPYELELMIDRGLGRLPSSPNLNSFQPSCSAFNTKVVFNAAASA